MDRTGNYQLDIVKAMSFVRWGGTPEEEKAVQTQNREEEDDLALLEEDI